jgi:isopenicillin N synthase-like dioxygenase
MEIPVIDVSQYFEGTRAERDKVAQAVDEACRELGLFTIVGHGIDTGLLETVSDLSRQFFDLSLEEKRRYQSPGGLGYCSIVNAEQALKISAISSGNLKESFNLRPDLKPELWPPLPAGFKPVMQDYYRLMEDFSGRLVQMLATALELPEDYFNDRFQDKASVLRLVNYPVPELEPRPDQYRCEIHSDYGSLTVLLVEDKPGGLEVMDMEEEWHEVEAIPGSLVINIGDIMAEWSGVRWTSSIHRVANPARKDWPESRRQSIIFFHNPTEIRQKVDRYLERCSTLWLTAPEIAE